jgi:hypothetical protein
MNLELRVTGLRTESLASAIEMVQRAMMVASKQLEASDLLL